MSFLLWLLMTPRQYAKYKQAKELDKAWLRSQAYCQARSDASDIARLLSYGWGHIDLDELKSISTSLKHSYQKSEEKRSISALPLEFIINDHNIVLVKVDRSTTKNQADWNSRHWYFSEEISDGWMPLDDLVSSVEKLETFVSSRGDDFFYETFNFRYIDNQAQLNIPEHVRMRIIENMNCSTKIPLHKKEMILHVNCIRRLHLASKMYSLGFFESYGHDRILDFFYKFHRDLSISEDMDIFFLNWFEVYESPSRSNYLDHLLHITRQKFIEDAEFIVAKT